MKERHWAQVTKIVGFHIRPDNTSDLSKVPWCALVLPRPLKTCDVFLRAGRCKKSAQFCTYGPFQLIDLSLDEYIEPLSALSEAATREHRIETGLMSMSAEWKKLELTLKPYKLTGTHSLTGPCADDIRALLEDHEIRTRTMQGRVGAVG